MKKTTAILLAIVLVIAPILLCFMSCGPKNVLDPDAPVTLTMWHIYGNQSDSPIGHLIDEFNATVGAQQGIVMKVTNVTTTPELKNLLLAAKNKVPGALDMPDLFSTRPDTVLNLGAENLVDFRDYFTTEELSRYVPGFIADGTIDDRLSVFPVARSTRVLFLNDGLFSRFAADTGVSYADLDTWEGLFAVAERYCEWSGGKSFCALDYPIQNVEFDMLSSGHEPRYTDADWYDTDDPYLYQSWMKFAVPLSQGHIVVSDTYANVQIITGEVAAGIGSSAAINYYGSAVTYPNNISEPLKLKALPLPKSGDGRQYIPVTGTGFAAYKTTEQKAQAAAVFLRWITEPERNLRFAVESGYMPAQSSSYDGISNYAFPGSAHRTLFEAMRTMVQNCTPTIRPEFAGYYNKVETLYPALRTLCLSLKKRADLGESPADLARETWDLFLSVSHS